MIYFYSGTPGSGKSLDMAREIRTWLKDKSTVISNTFIDVTMISKNPSKLGKFIYKDNDDMTVDFLIEYAIENHIEGKEHQSLIVFDEAQMKFAPNTVKLKCQEDKYYRQNWLKFFTQHRHLGYDIIIVSQFDRLIDAQIRCLFEYNIVHRKANNFGVIGALLTILHIPLFVKINYWYGCNQITSREFFFYRKKYAKIYNSYAFMSKIKEEYLIKKQKKSNEKVLTM